jgi:hypothetical protein
MSKLETLRGELTVLRAAIDYRRTCSRDRRWAQQSAAYAKWQEYDRESRKSLSSHYKTRPGAIPA